MLYATSTAILSASSNMFRAATVIWSMSVCLRLFHYVELRGVKYCPSGLNAVFCRLGDSVVKEKKTTVVNDPAEFLMRLLKCPK